MSGAHLKAYPVKVPNKTMKLNAYKRALSETAIPTTPVSSISQSRSRSRSDLSESSHSNLSLENALSVSSSNTSCPPSPAKTTTHVLVTPESDARTTDSGGKITQVMSTPQDDYLLLIEPNPVSPPEYNSLPPGGCPKFPIFHHEDVPHGLHNGLPEYTPSIYKIGPISRKVEWISPYEASTSRSWKNYIIELNSTQLNLYSVPSNLESHMLGFQVFDDCSMKIDDYGSHPPVKVSQDDDFYALNSTLSNRYDYEFFNYCKRMKAVKKLVRSYSLQHCRIGLASDYKKKTNVLRVRIESEQILLAFQNTKDLIDWNLALNIGKDLALDLIDRELPKYRTVPRRRRRRADGLSEPLFVNYDSVASTYNRSRSHSEPTNLINKMSRLKLRLRRDSSVNLSTSTVNSSASSILANSNSNSVLSMNTLSSVPQSDLTSIEPSSIEPSGIEDNDNDDDLSDYNSDYDDDFDNDNDDSELERPRAMKPRVSKSKSEEKRWSPNPENQTIRKYYKNSLRCIKPLNFDDTWVSKNLVKPTSFSMVNLTSFNGSLNSLSVQSFKRNDVNLGKVPNHYVKEFIVGTHGLIPRQL